MKTFLTLGIYCLFLLMIDQSLFGQIRLDPADQYYRSRDWEKALEEYTKLARQNSYEGYFWQRKGAVLYQLKRYTEAIDAFQRSYDLGFSPKWAANGLAYSYLQNQDKEQAAKWFETYITIDPSTIDQLRDSNMEGIMGKDRYERLFGKVLPESASRTEKWEADLEFLTNVVLRSHYNPYIKTSPEEWQRHIQSAKERVPSLSDKEIALEFSKIMALAGDGHTNLWPMFNEAFKFKMLPITFDAFKDGVFITATAPEYKALLKAELIQIGDQPIEELIQKIGTFYACENPRLLLNRIFVLCIPEILKMMGATDNEEIVRIKINRNGKEEVVALNTASFDQNIFGPSLELKDSSWINIEQFLHPVPLWLQGVENPYRFEYLSDKKTVYFQYNSIRNDPKVSFAVFVDSLFNFIQSNSTESLIIDLRNNGGGSSDIYPILIAKIIQHPAINKRGKLFTLISRRTYSAAQNLATDLEFWTNTLFVGEPTGCSPNFIGENKLFRLPNSKLLTSVSDRYHQRGASSADKRIWIAPHIPAEFSSEDYIKGNDPGLNAIFDYIISHKD